MNSDIQFGEIEESSPQVRLRPDRNRHYAVVAVDAPAEEDLPIFVDVDALLDMEDHALSDTGVELGGVLLGGQYEDENGNAYVLVTDSLRAKHYESTKGSFKFTHETWSEITRERELFPEELQMVGWYHTHPDWGVFLSGMDLFICDHFFNRRLDVALVIDPCRGDRGMFQWTGDAAERIRRTGGFYLIASRFRQQELEFHAAQLRGLVTMANPRFAQGVYPPPVVNIADNHRGWQSLAVMGMLTLQFCLLLLLVWKLVVPPGQTAADKQLAAIDEKVDSLTDAGRQAARAELDMRVLDRIVAAIGQGAQGLPKELQQQEQELQRMQTNVYGHQARIKELEGQYASKENEFNKYKADTEHRLGQLQKTIQQQKAGDKVRLERIATLTARLKKVDPTFVAQLDDEETGEQKAGIDWRRTALAVAGGLVIAVVIFGVASVMLRRDDERRPMRVRSDDDPNVSGDDDGSTINQ